MKNKNKTVWSNRFGKTNSKNFQRIGASINIDKRLYNEDIQASIVHVQMLIKKSIIPKKDGIKIIKGLKKIKKEIDKNKFKFKEKFEDIHQNIEKRLFQIIGDSAGHLHTARSRNDQVVTDFKMWVKKASFDINETINFLIRSLLKKASRNIDTVMPGFTHLQVAQPVTLAMHLSAYDQMMERDKSRVLDCKNRLNESPLGACALSGTGFNIDREMTASKLGFNNPMVSTMDAVSARDFATEFLFICAQCGLHLSRLAEEIILWVTPQFGFARLSDAWSTGSSIMPQKKNPDAAELIRAKTGRLNGNLIQLLTVMKALPLAYNKDMQEDKQAVFESFDTISLCLKAMTGMVETMEFHAPIMKKAAESGYATATEIADWLVRNLDMPFRDAHHVTGAIVKMAVTKNCKLDDLSLSDMQDIEPRITDDIFNVLDVEKAVASRK